MQINQLIAVAASHIEAKKVSCKGGISPKNGRSRICKVGTDQDCTGKNLYNNMKNNSTTHAAAGLGVVVEKRSSWALSDVSKTAFPCQAHHLIPKNHLPGHPVCVYLAFDYPHKKVKLLHDSNYDTDDHLNGYCMPYACELAEWRAGRDKLDLAFDVMKRTEVQLHQGSHAHEIDLKKINRRLAAEGLPLMPTPSDADSTDPFEDEKIERPCYLKAIDRLLDTVRAQASFHYGDCEVCNKKGDPIEIEPLVAIVAMMHQVSKITQILICASALHVSWYACANAHRRGHLVYEDGAWKLGGRRGVAARAAIRGT